MWQALCSLTESCYLNAEIWGLVRCKELVWTFNHFFSLYDCNTRSCVSDAWHITSCANLVEMLSPDIQAWKILSDDTQLLWSLVSNFRCLLSSTDDYDCSYSWILLSSSFVLCWWCVRRDRSQHDKCSEINIYEVYCRITKCLIHMRSNIWECWIRENFCQKY